MKTKHILVTIIFLLTSFLTYSQEDLGSKLADAENSYASGNLSDARFQLQQAMIELDRVIGKEVLKTLPATVDGKEANIDDDGIFVQGAGITGLNVTRSYGVQSTESGSIQFNMMNHSPYLQALTAFLANPIFMAAGTGQKMVKIQGYKSVIDSSTSDTGEIESFTVQIPFGDTLISLEFDKYSDENKVVSLANEFNLKEIAKLVGQ